MPPIVMLYQCEATFTGETSVTYAAYPALDSIHRCILFVRQMDNQADMKRAAETLAEWGWSDVVVKSTGAIQAESLNQPSMQIFRQHYEECLEQGDSLVWYPEPPLIGLKR